jgi:hypothetical protein
MRVFLVLPFALVSGCTLLLDPSEHRGGGDAHEDASELVCDRDGDGFDGPQCDGNDCDDDDPARYPGAAPICNNGVFEGCPGDAPLQPVDLFGVDAVERQGALRPVTIASGPHLAEIGMGALAYGTTGYGSAIVIAGENDGNDEYRPIRIDVPLDAPGEHSPGSLGNLSGATRIGSITTSTGGPSVLGIGLSREGVGHWTGIISLAADTISWTSWLLEDQLEGLGLAVFESEGPTTVLQTFRQSNDPDASISWIAVGPAAQAGSSTVGVPLGKLRTRVARSGAIMMQDEQGGFWFFRVFAVADAQVGTWESGQGGKAAFIQVDGDQHVLAFHRQSTNRFYFSRFNCVDYSTPFCWPIIALGSDWASFPANADGGEIPDGILLSEGRSAFTVVRRFSDGDEITLRLVNPSGTGFVQTPPIPLLDTRPSGDRVLDVKLDLVEATLAHHLIAVATVGSALDGDADRIVLTGVRGCIED